MFAGMGSSAGTVMRLHGAPPLEPGSPAPALQRSARPVFRVAEVVREADCLASHMTQLQERERQRRREKRAVKIEAKTQRAALRAAVKAALEAQEEEKRRDHLRLDGLMEQHRSSRVRALADHVDGLTADTYWPYQKHRPGLPDLTPGEYIKELDAHVERQQGHRNEGLTLHWTPPKGKGILEDRMAAQFPAEMSRQEKQLVAARRREHVLRQAELRRQLAAETAPDYRPYAEKLTADLQRATVENLFRQQRQREELKEALQAQQVDKRARELAEHRHIYGSHCGDNVLAEKQDAYYKAQASRFAEYKRDLKEQIGVQRAERRRRQEELAQAKSQCTERALFDERKAVEREKQRGARESSALPFEWQAQRDALHNARVADKAAASAAGLAHIAKMTLETQK
jgi:hypothetical protein